MHPVDYACSKIREDDLLHKGFLKPIEIHLKTYQTQRNIASNHLKSTSLPAGLKVAFKKQSITNNKFSLQDITEITQKPTLEELRALGQDNLLTLMKDYGGIELAICVCMYSEDKRMLKSTLAGIAENISNIVTKLKISSDKIGVFVIMDGIEKVDKSVVEYFEELERQSNINLGENIAPTLTEEEMLARARIKSQEQIDEEQLKNVNNFLFDPVELKDRNERRFSSVRDEYEDNKKLLNTILGLKRRKPNFDDLPNKLRQFFIEQAKKQQSEEMSDEDLVEKYTSDVRKARPMILKALSDGQKYCREYIDTRQNLAHLTCFRKKIRHGIDKLPPQQNCEISGQYLNDEIKEASLYTTMNLFLCVKYKNGGKLSSHNWFFNGFCKELKPKYAVLLDVGLKPQGNALYNMYKYMKNNENVGGVCGYMSLKIQKLEERDELKDDDVDFFTRFWLKFVDIQRTQLVEYHFAHLLDKPFQASFGFIHVLPGAFSAYNMKAILNYGEEEDELLKSYFTSIDASKKNCKVINSNLSIKNLLLRTLLPDLFNSCCIDIDPDSDEQMLYNENIYLAEDRILCMGIHKKGKEIVYLADAFATVDPIKTVSDLLLQRKRWNNGSYFAFEKVKKEMNTHWEASNTQGCLLFQIFYLTLMNALSYFAPSFFIFTVHIAMQAFRADVLPNLFGGVIPDPNNNQIYNGFVYTIDFINVLMIMSVVFFSLHMTTKEKQFKSYIYFITTLFGIFSVVVFIVLMVDVIRGLTTSSAYLIQNKAKSEDIPGGIEMINAMRWVLVASTSIYVVPILVYITLFRKLKILCQIIAGSFSFLFYGPTYLIVLNIYSLCRIDDISWGTKGLDSNKSDQNTELKDSWRVIKFIHVCKYIIWNLIISVVLLSLGASYTPRFFITIVVITIMSASLSLKIIIAVVYLIKYKLKNCRSCKKRGIPNLNEESNIKQNISLFRDQMMSEIRVRLDDVYKEYQENLNNRSNGSSFIQTSKSYRQVSESYIKKKKMTDMQSQIIQTRNMAQFSLRLPIIPEVQEPISRPPPRRKRYLDEESPQKQPIAMQNHRIQEQNTHSKIYNASLIEDQLPQNLIAVTLDQQVVKGE